MTLPSVLGIVVGAKAMTDTKSDLGHSPVTPRIADERNYVTGGFMADVGPPQDAILREVDAALERIATGIAAEKKALEALIERMSRRTK